MSACSAVVVAHPDDEILWLSSAMAAARRKAVRRDPARESCKRLRSQAAIETSPLY